MEYNALGLVEVRGYLGAVAAADAALKAAGVSCIGLEVIKGGLVTVKLSGEVGAVQAAVDAGVEIATQLDVLLTSHVIPRLHEETAVLVTNTVDENNEKPVEVIAVPDPPVGHMELAAVAATLEPDAGTVNDTVVAFERLAENKPASRGKTKSASAAKRKKNVKKTEL